MSSDLDVSHSTQNLIRSALVDQEFSFSRNHTALTEIPEHLFLISDATIPDIS